MIRLVIGFIAGVISVFGVKVAYDQLNKDQKIDKFINSKYEEWCKDE